MTDRETPLALTHSDTPLHPPLVGGPTQDLHLFQATPYPEANIGQVEGPNTFTTTSWCHLLNPLRHLLQGVHWPDGQDAGTSPEGAQESTDIGDTAQSAVAEHAQSRTMSSIGTKLK